jgi:isoleucyl-tRNA synthetase
MLAPVLSFTSDEAWGFVPGKSTESVHETVWQPLGFERSEAERTLWKRLFEWRELALPALERARQAKEIGKSLEAKAIFSGPQQAVNEILPEREALRELLNVSQLEIQPAAAQAVTVSVTKAAGQKCERCWHWETDVGINPAHPTLCARCVQAVTA